MRDEASRLTQSEVHSNAVDLTYDYFIQMEKNNEPIKNLSEIYDILKEQYENKFLISLPTFYRIVKKELKCYKVANRYYLSSERTTNFAEILEYRPYNKMLCYHINKSEYGSLLADKINEYYDWKSSFHCIALNDTLLCLYYYKKGDSNSLTASEIKSSIDDLMEKIVLKIAE